MQHREDHPLTESIDYYHETVTTQFLDHIIVEIEIRLGDAPTNVTKGFSIIPSSFINKYQTKWKKLNIYGGDLPEMNSLQTELLMWEVFWKDH